MTEHAHDEEEERTATVIRLPVALNGRELDPAPARKRKPREVLAVVLRPVSAAVHRPDGSVRNPLPGAWNFLTLGAYGVARIAGRWHRWISADDHAQSLAAGKGEFIESVRGQRKRATKWALLTFAGTDLLGGWVMDAWPWWLPLAAAGGGLLGVGAIIEAVHRRAGEDGGDQTPSRELGTHPGSKAVRYALAAAGQLGKFEDLRVLPPGVIRDQDSAVPAWVAIVDLRQGVPAVKAVKRQQEIAAACGVDMTQLDVDPVKGNNGRIKLWVADYDPLTGDAIPSPLKGRTTPFDAWAEKVVVGKDRRGRDVAFSLPERSLLTGGEPGGGKSVSCNNVLCAVTLDPHIDLRMVDGKGGADLIDYEPLCTQFLAEPDPRAMLAICNQIQDEMSDRYRQLKGMGERKLTREVAEATGMRLVFLHIDEIQFFAAARQKTYASDDEDAAKVKIGDLIVDALWDIVSRGRAAGFITSAATQRPAAEVVPTKLRDILSIRWALRCTTPQASDTILGQGWAGQGFNAARIDVMQRGAGLLLAEGSVPMWLRSCFLSDGDVRAITRTAYRIREAAGTLPPSDTHPGRLLLTACMKAFGESDKLWTADLLARLSADPAWSVLADDPAELARRLRPYGVAPGQVWISDGHGSGANRQGYTRAGIERGLNQLLRR